MKNIFIINYENENRKFREMLLTIKSNSNIRAKQMLVKDKHIENELQYYSNLDELNYKASDIVLIYLNNIAEELVWLGRAKESNKFLIVYSGLVDNLVDDKFIARNCNIFFNDPDELINFILDI